MKRRDFIGSISKASVLLTTSDWKKLKEDELFDISKSKKRIRFVVASDGHYGQPNTKYEEYFSTLVNRINEEHNKEKFAFAVINGDIIHDDYTFMPLAKKALDDLDMQYYVTQGNHDHASPLEWESVWKLPVNFHFNLKHTGFIGVSSSNIKGEYLCPDLPWLKQTLEKNNKFDNLFLFVHINQAKLTTHGINSPDFMTLVSKYKNLRCIFNGHDHDEDGIKKSGNIPFVFDAHFGGSWGTEYRGFRVVELMKDGTIVTWVMNPWEQKSIEKL